MVPLDLKKVGCDNKGNNNDLDKNNNKDDKNDKDDKEKDGKPLT